MFKVQSIFYNTTTNHTHISLVGQVNESTTLVPALILGDVTSKNEKEIIELALEDFFKKVYIDRAMPEAIQKVDKVSVEMTETRELLNNLQEAIRDAETLLSILENKTQSIEQKQNKINEAFVLSENLSDEQKAILLEQFKPWTVGETYEKDEVVNYNGVLYRVIKGITAQGHYLPDSVPSEYTPLRNTTTVIDGETVEVINDWVQPTGAHDAYEKGNKVRFNGKVYESTIDNNAYSPADYPDGWKEVE